MDGKTLNPVVRGAESKGERGIGTRTVGCIPNSFANSTINAPLYQLNFVFNAPDLDRFPVPACDATDVCAGTSLERTTHKQNVSMYFSGRSEPDVCVNRNEIPFDDAGYSQRSAIYTYVTSVDVVSSNGV